MTLAWRHERTVITLQPEFERAGDIALSGNRVFMKVWEGLALPSLPEALALQSSLPAHCYHWSMTQRIHASHPLRTSVKNAAKDCFSASTAAEKHHVSDLRFQVAGLHGGRSGSPDRAAAATDAYRQIEVSNRLRNLPATCIVDSIPGQPVTLSRPNSATSAQPSPTQPANHLPSKTGLRPLPGQVQHMPASSRKSEAQSRACSQGNLLNRSEIGRRRFCKSSALWK